MISKTMLGSRMVRLYLLETWCQCVYVVKDVPGVCVTEDLYNPVEVHQVADKVMSEEGKTDTGWSVPRERKKIVEI